MVSKLQNYFGKKFLAGVFVTLFVLTSFLPVFTPRAHALFGIGDFGVTVDVAYLAKRILDTGAQILAKKVVDQMIKSTIAWANNGFDGNPAYVTDPKSYYGKLAEGVVTDEILNSNLNYICSPFQAQIKLSLVKVYSNADYQPRCTFNQIGSNLENFYKNFNDGGWVAWDEVSQNDANNPYGSYLSIKGNIDSKLANELSLNQEERQINTGYLNQTECVRKNVEPANKAFVEAWLNNESLDGGDINEEKYALYPNWDPSKPDGACLQEKTTTPGGQIKGALDKMLPSGFEKLVSVTQIDQLVGAFAAGLLDRYVTGPKGLFSSGYADTFNKSSDSNSGISNTSFGWVHCANEGQACGLPNGEENQVRFGIEGHYKTLSLRNGFMCTTDTFGDPAPGKAKTCDYLDLTGNHTSSTGSTGGTDSTGGTGNNGKGPGTVANYLTCNPQNPDVLVNEQAVWVLTSGYSATTTYGWFGDEVVGDPVDTRSTSIILVKKYQTEGSKSAGVTAFNEDGSPIKTTDCNGVMNVTQ